MLKHFLLLPSLFLLSLTIAFGQSDSDPYQGSSQTLGTQGNSGCLDPNSATCVPQSSSQNPGSQGGSSPGQIPQNNGQENGTFGGVNAPFGTGNQPLTQPNYRDEGALPDQARSRLPGYQYVAPEPLTEFQRFVAETTGQVLPIFGARLFRQVPTTFAPVDQIPVPADAIVGPGDLLRIRIWGQVNFSADLRVDRSGEVYLPQVGPVHVAGLQYSDLDRQLQTVIGRVYKNFHVSAQLGQIRSIQIYVVGRARRPGTYTVSSLTTLVDALFASGGPALEGSLRHIQLKRAGKIVTDFDMYDLLVNGDKSGDRKLEPGDVIYIPSAGPQVAVLGSVKTPAIYEARLPETIGQVLEEAAGTTNIAGGRHISLERLNEADRLEDGQGREAQQIAATAEGLATLLMDGDLVRINPAVPSYRKTLTLRGNTANAGRYRWHTGMHLSELFPEREALLTRNYWWQRTRLGLPSPEFERTPSLDYLRQPNEPQTLPITPEEQQQLRQNRQQYLQQRYAQQRALQQTQAGGTAAQTAGGLDPSAAALGGYGATSSSGLGNETDSLLGLGGLGDSQLLDPSNNSDPSLGGYPSGTLYNQGFAQGSSGGQQSGQGSALAERNVVTENTANAQSITEVKLSAPEIDWKYAVIERLDPLTLKTSLVPFDLGRLVMDHDTAQDLELQPGDTITIFSQADIHVPVEQQTRLVRLEGEFAHSGVYSVQPGETLQALVQRAGGLSPGAYLFGSEFSRASVRAAQQRQLDEYVQNLQLQIERGVLATTSAATSSAADLASANVAGSEARELVARLRQIRATGRIVLSLRAFSQGTEALPTLGLEDGDTLYVPAVPSSVNVIGAVYDQNSFIYTKGAHVLDYVRLAGGENRNSDRKHPFVIRADGSVISQDEVGEKKFNQVVIQPGDTIVVLEKTFGPTKLRNILNFSQLFSQLAIGSAVLGTVL